jgi:hypothetical protein
MERLMIIVLCMEPSIRNRTQPRHQEVEEQG